MVKWQARDIIKALNLKGGVSLSFQATGISIDSRTLKPGEIFIAIQGGTFDGHHFIKDAIDKGAAGVIISQPPPVLLTDYTYFVVPDTLQALTQLGQYARQRSAAQVIAITGSAGKTTTKEWLAHILRNFGSTVFSKDSYNNQFGVPLSLSNLEPHSTFGVFEVGMNHGGEIEPLTKLIQPHVAIITTITEAHLGYFQSLDSIAEEKAKIFTGLQPDGTVILNYNSPYFDLLSQRAKEYGAKTLISVGTTKGADIQLLDSRYDATVHKTWIQIKIYDQVLSYSLAALGEHYILNSLMVLAATYTLGLDLEKALQAIEHLQPLAGRGHRHTICLGPDKTITLIDDAYNAHPASMKLGLESFSQIHLPGRRIAVLGEMRELGDKSAAYHQELIPLLEQANVDLIFATGAYLKPVFDAFPTRKQGAFAEDAEALWQPLIDSLEDGDVVFIKGSNGTKVYTLVHKFLSLNQDVLSSQLGVV